MKIVNLTPHPINLEVDGVLQAFMPEALPARVTEQVERIPIHEGSGILFVKKTFGEVRNLPEPEVGTIYVVSALVAQKAWADGRPDVFCPGDPIRDSEGKIVGAKSLCGSPSL